MKQRGDPIVVIGAGGAGMTAAWRAASRGAEVLLLERNKKAGVKLLISGGGRCNVTHAGPVDELWRAFTPREGRFLKPSLFRFSNDDVVRMIEDRGVKTLVRQDGRVYPVSGHAEDIVRALKRAMDGSGVHVRLNSRVTSVVSNGGGISGVSVNGESIASQHVIVSSGGVSYPRTGTTGDGLVWMRELGHTIVPLRPALAPIGIEPPLPVEWRGVAVRGGRLSVVADGRSICSWDDDILFSHEGLSGPAALEVSRSAAISREKWPTVVQLDFLPAKEFTELDDALNMLIRHHRGKQIGTVVEALLPNRIVPFLLASVDVDPGMRGHTLTREKRHCIVRLLKSWTIGRVGTVNIERGEVTAGGVELSEVEPHSMRSRRIRGLYLCGEILDVAGPIGGYNLQAAFSTGYVAGESAAMDWLR
jgi:predicted Rossmann fold flavoprotein